MESYKIHLSEAELPQAWYNLIQDLPAPLPPYLHPATGEPITPQDLAAIFPLELIRQEVSQERWIPIPDEVQRIYKLWRPSPLHRARNLEKALGTPARIYYKNESVSPAGSHKPNTAVAQAYYNQAAGIKRLATETGAGQWGSALALACNFFGLGCTVYMVKVSYYQKPYRRSLMHIWGAEVFPSPTDRTQAGRALLAKDPETPGSLGMAISEAVEDAASHPDTNYSLGSVLNHVLLHQTVVGLEAKKQLALAGETPDLLIGCVGGGSNFAGFCFPFAGPAQGPGHPFPGGGAHRLPHPHPGDLHLRLWRHRRPHPLDPDVHPGPQLRAPGDSRRWPALPWRRPAPLPAGAGQGDRGPGLLSDPGL